MNTFQVKEDSRSLNKPAWVSDSLSLTQVEDRNYDLEGQFCSIRTTRAIYDRVLIIKENRSNFIVRFTTYDSKSKGYISASDIVQKRDILNLRIYEN